MNAISCQLLPRSYSDVNFFTVSQAGPGKYRVNYVPVHIGVLQVQITVMNGEIEGSPFSLNVLSSIAPGEKDLSIQVIPGIERPLSVAVSSEGMIAVTQGNTYSITVLRKDGAYAGSVGSHGYSPGQFMDIRSIALTRNDHIVVADGERKDLQVFSMDGVFIGHVSETPETFRLWSPVGVAVHPAGSIYVVDRDSNAVKVFNPDLSPSHSFTMYKSGPGEFSVPCGIAIDVEGKVFVADSGNHRVQVFSSSGHFIFELSRKGVDGGQLADPVAVATDNSHYAYVSESGGNMIAVFDTFNGRGHFVKSVGGRVGGGERLRSPAGLATDTAGNLFVCDYGNARLVVY